MGESDQWERVISGRMTLANALLCASKEGPPAGSKSAYKVYFVLARKVLQLGVNQLTRYPKRL